MNFLTHFFLSVSFVLTLAACRASFEDIQKPNLVSSGDDLGAKDANVKPAGTDEAPILESTQELP
ncbi:MAG: hypothetical protein NTX25_18835, partial [Proteobacteria bacterium]|nr:hypothetical protein [Pseudomonadota bacterium]